jgi:hypothetical protein
VGGFCTGVTSGAETGVLDTTRVDWGLCSDSRRRMRTALTTPVALWVPGVHAVCPHNEIAALVKRSLGPVPPQVFEPLGRAVCTEVCRLRRFVRLYDQGKWTHLQTALSYSGALQRRYIEAERSLREDGPVTNTDVFLRPFLKAEKVNGKLGPKPRMIYPRSPRYNLSLASRLKPFERWLWGNLRARKFLGCGVGRIVAKGLNQRQRANLVVRKFSSLEDCEVFEVDGRAFEAHVGPDQLKAEHAVYESAFPGDRGLQRLLREQLVLTGKTPSGVKFSRDGGRASGDFNTGMGNTIIMLVVVVAVLRRHNIPYDVLVDGDNALVFLRHGDTSRVLRDFAADVLNLSGHEVTLDRPVNFIEGIRFGQSAPIFLGPGMGYCMVREYTKVLSNAFSSHRWLREPVFAREWMRGVAGCELSLARGVPVLQAWALELQKLLGSPDGVRAFPHTDYLVAGAWFAGLECAVEVSAETRVSFARAFGLEPEEQIRLENSFGASLRRVAGQPYRKLDHPVFEQTEYAFACHEAFGHSAFGW